MATNSVEERVICIEKSCTGCAACSNICPKGCITMVGNSWGESHPHIDKATCIDCGRCYSVCPNNNRLNLLGSKCCYAAWRKNAHNRKDSSSGGVVALLYEKCFEKGWSVYGVEYNRSDGFNFTHALSKEELGKYKGSKYVQANVGTIYQNVKEDLTNGKHVLFVGSPCQVAGLESFIKNTSGKKYRNNLVTVDFLCHGTVPQQYLLEEIIAIEKKKKIQVEKVVFRSNDEKRNYYLTLFQNDLVVYSKKADKQRYFYCFLHSITCRESCLECLYKQKSRVGDITVGDFIGIGRKTPIDIPIGINPSLVLVNSPNGEDIIKEIDDDCILFKRDIQEAIDGGPSFHSIGSVSKRRSVFKKYYPSYGFASAADRAIKVEMNVKYYLISPALKFGRRVLRKVKCGIKKVKWHILL